MADAGAWQSGVYDNGRDFHHGDKATATGVPAAGAGLYNPTVSMGRSNEGAAWTITSIALRCATILCTTIAFAIIASNEGSAYCYDGAPDCVIIWRALASSNVVYLLAIDVIVCFYSIVQLILSIVSVCTGKPVLKGPLSPAATITFICDQILTYMLMCGCGAGAATSQAAVACDYFKVFCDKNHASVAMSFIAFLCIALSAGMAYFRLYRIRG